MYLVKNFLRNKTLREKALSLVALMKAVYSELIVTMDKRFESGYDFPNELYDKPSEHIKFELLSLLRSQIMMNGGRTIFEECLQMLHDFSYMIQKTIHPNAKISKSHTLNYELGAFFSEMLASNLQTEIKAFYEFNRDLLWFINWMVREDLDARDMLKNSLLDPKQFANTKDTETGFISSNRTQIKHYEAI